MAYNDVDARRAIKDAREGRCRDAMKRIYDSAPHMQYGCTGAEGAAAAKDFKHAMVVVAGLCTVNTKPSQYKSTGFHGVRGRRRR